MAKAYPGSEGYRNTPTAQILTWLDRIDPSLLGRAHFLIATGTHDAPTEGHYVKIFGELEGRARERVAFHDARDLSSMVEVGRDGFGATVCGSQAGNSRRAWRGSWARRSMKSGSWRW